MQPAIASVTAKPASLPDERPSAFALRSPAARVLAVWSALAVGAAGQFVAEAAVLHRAWTAGDLLARLSILPLWALATPFVLRSARRWRIGGPNAVHHALLHLAFGTAFLLAANVLIHLPLLFGGRGPGPVLSEALASFLHFYPGGIAVYAAIVAFGGWRSGDASGSIRWVEPAGAARAEAADDEGVDDRPSVDRSTTASAPYPEVVPVKTALRTHLVPIGEIDWIEGDGDHVVIHRGAEGLRTRSTLKSLAATLDPARFVRAHRSAVVRLAAVKEIQPYFHGDFVVILHSGATVRLARSRRRDVEALLGNRL
jgi:hypothetical protein